MVFVFVLLGFLQLVACNPSGSEGPPEKTNPTDSVSEETQDPTAIRITFGNSDFPDVNIKRGYVLRDALDRKTEDILDDLRKGAEIGMKMVLLPRDFNQFDARWASGSLPGYYRSYRSRGNIYFGGSGEAEEFIRNGSQVQVTVNSKYIDICKEAVNQGLQLVIQCSGSPVSGNNDGTVTQVFDLDPTRIFHEKARFYALPAPDEIEEHADAVFTWMKTLNDQLGVTDAIWLGHQEPYHTAGYPSGRQTDAGSVSNIDAYAQVWKPIADKLRENDMLVGGLQMNEVRKFYANAAEAIETHDVPIDFFSIQNYFADRNELTIDEAIKQLDARPGTSGKQILFNRYNYHSDRVSTNAGKYNSAVGIIEFLKAEIQLLDKADRVYGYNLFTGAQGEAMLEELLLFLNTAPVSRLELTNLPDGLRGFALGDSTSLSVVLWNESSSSIDADLALSKFPETFAGYQPKITRGSGSSLTGVAASWDSETYTIRDLNVGVDEFIMIR